MVVQHGESILKYTVALVVVCVAVLLRLLLDPLLSERLPFITLFAVITFMAWYGGPGPAAFSVVLGLAAVALFILEPRGSLMVDDPADRFGLVFYAALSAGCIALFSRLRAATLQAERSAVDAQQRSLQLQQELSLRRQAEGEVIQESERLRVTMASIGDGVITTDDRGHVEFLNQVARDLTGWTLQEAEGVPLEQVFNIVNETTREPVENPALRSLRDGQIVGLANHTLLIAKDGSERPIDDSAAPIRDQDGKILGSVLVFRDISERKKSEANLLERLRLLALNADVGRALVQGDQLADMLQRCAAALVEHLDGAFARVWVLNTEQKMLELAASAGLYTHLDGPHSRVPVGKYKIGLIAAEARPHLTNAVVGDPRVNDQQWARQQGMVAFAGYPLLVEQRVVGVMAMFARHVLTESTLQAMESIANGIALGIERKVIQERKRQQQEWLRVTLASIADAVISTDVQGRIQSINAVAEALTGWEAIEAQGQSLDRVFLIHDERTGQAMESPVDKVLREGTVVGLANHMVLVAQDGTERPIDSSAAPIRDDTGKMIGVALVFRDVAQRRNSEQAVRASEARKSAILETALDCIITIDSQGRVVEFNPAAERTFGYRHADIVGQELASFIIPPGLREQHRSGMSRYLATGEGPVLNRRLELSAMRADGTEFPTELAIARIPTDGPPMFTAYLRDISERTRADQHRNARLAVNHVLAQATSSDEAIRGVLQAVCENLCWDAGLFWSMCKADSTLQCTHSWHCPDVSIDEFESASFARSFKKGEGLPGRVWENNEPVWILEIGHDSNFPRLSLAVNCGLHSAFACPIVIGDQTLGVIEFVTKRLREPDLELLEVMRTMTGIVAQFLERTHAQEQVRQSELELTDFFENATVGLHWVGPDGTILRVNQSELDMLGYTREEYVGHPASEFHVDEQAVGEMLRRLQSGREPLREYPARLRCKDGSIKDVLIDSSVMWKDGQFAHTRSFTRDVTQQKRSQQTARFLADASAALAVLVDFDSTLHKVASLAVPYFADWATVDLAEADGALRRVAVAHVDTAKVELARELHRRRPPNPAASQGAWNILRTGCPELIRHIPDELLEQAAENDDELLRMFRELGLKSYIGVPLKVRGKLLGVLTFICAESGHLYDHTDLAVAQDLADRAAIAVENAQLYRELREADRRKDEFLATLAHELRNPLAPIRNGLQVMQLVGSDSQLVTEARSMMERQLGQMVRLIDDLLDVSRITRNKIDLRKQQVALATVIQSAVETSRPLIEQMRHTFSLTVPPDDIYLHADMTRLAQVFSNLLNNSAKYTEPGGHISLVAEVHANMVAVRIRDNGLGIPVDALPRVFDMFSQVDRNMERSQGGLGIGLMLVKRLVEMHGGTVEALSDGPGHGSEFVVRLPTLIESKAQLVPDDSHPAIAAPPHRRILIVDDNQDAALSLKMMLNMMGNETHTAHDGLAAVDAADTYRPDAILLDIGLPKLNGYDACRRIREQPWSRDTVIIALTGWGQDEDRRRSLDAGFDHHMVKPVDPTELQRLLAESFSATARSSASGHSK